MKNKIGFLLIIIGISLQSCTIFYKSIRVEKDPVLKVKRVLLNESFVSNTFKTGSQSYTQTLNFLKELDENNQTTYTIYDVIRLPLSSFELKEDIYVVIDREAFLLSTKFENTVNSRNVAEKKAEIMLADSTKTTVTTGYEVNNERVIRMIHTLDDVQVDKMLQANSVELRYYVGPSIISSVIKNSKLSRVKKWIKR